MNFNIERLKRKQQECEIEFLHGEVNRLKGELSDALKQLQGYKKVRKSFLQSSDKKVFAHQLLLMQHQPPPDVDFMKVSPTLVKHVSYESLEKAKKRLFAEGMFCLCNEL